MGYLVASAEVGPWLMEADHIKETEAHPGWFELSISRSNFDLTVKLRSLSSLKSILEIVEQGEQKGVDPTDPSRSFAGTPVSDLFIFVSERNLSSSKLMPSVRLF